MHYERAPPLQKVLLKGMSSEKHFSLPERPKYFSGIQPPTTLPTFFLWLLERCGLSRSGPVSRAATGPRCFFLPGFSSSLFITAPFGSLKLTS